MFSGRLFVFLVDKYRFCDKMKTVFKLKYEKRFHFMEGIVLVKAQYKTKQMVEILAFLESVKGSHVTVSDICHYFEEKGIAVGTTTVYRQLEKMVKEGVVAKYVVDGGNSACFEYIGEHDKEEKQTCYHCKCELCGKLVHLHCKEVESLKHHMMEHHGFIMDPVRTVFFGICSECRQKEA